MSQHRTVAAQVLQQSCLAFDHNRDATHAIGRVRLRRAPPHSAGTAGGTGPPSSGRTEEATPSGWFSAWPSWMWLQRGFWDGVAEMWVDVYVYRGGDAPRPANGSASPGWVWYNNMEERHRHDTTNAFFKHELLPLRRVQYGQCAQPSPAAVRRCAEAHGSDVAPGVAARRQHALEFLTPGDTLRTARAVDGEGTTQTAAAPAAVAQPLSASPVAAAGSSRGVPRQKAAHDGDGQPAPSDGGSRPPAHTSALRGSTAKHGGGDGTGTARSTLATFLVPARPDDHLARHYGDVTTVRRSGARGMRCALVQV